MIFEHDPVLLEECIENLNIKPDGIYIDGTIGGSGHSGEILKRLNENGLLIGFDQDENAVETSVERLAGYGMRVDEEYIKNIYTCIRDTDRRNTEEKDRQSTKDKDRQFTKDKKTKSTKEQLPKFAVIKTNFENIKNVLERLNIKAADGILLDIGVSSNQLDDPERGFSYMKDSDLDMRMDTDSDFSAKNVVNDYSEKELRRVIRDYGEENWAARIAKFIVEKRKQKPINTTKELVDIIEAAVPKGARTDGSHPAKRTFQAIRIETNNELRVLEKVIDDSIPFLKNGGRICIITFHSLEDRIVKTKFRFLEKPCVCPGEFPVCVCGKEPVLKIITRKPITPDEKEVLRNKRAKSAKLRVAEKIFQKTKS